MYGLRALIFDEEKQVRKHTTYKTIFVLNFRAQAGIKREKMWWRNQKLRVHNLW